MPLALVWSRASLKRLREIQVYIARDKHDAAARLSVRIVALAEALRAHPYLGRVGSETGIRELVIGGTPYIIFYKVRGKRVTISTTWHGAQNRKR